MASMGIKRRNLATGLNHLRIHIHIRWRRKLLLTEAKQSFYSNVSQSKSFASLFASAESTTTSTRSVPHGRYIDGFNYGSSGLPVDLEALFASRRPPHGADWEAIVDAYLPAHLRLQGRDASVAQPVLLPTEPIKTLPQVLKRAREKFKIDILSYIGVNLGRWDAVKWLVQAMMEHCGAIGKTEKRLRWVRDVLPSQGHVLDDLTGDPIDLQPLETSKISLDSMMDSEEDHGAEAAIPSRQQTLAQLWQTLGMMIISAADRSPDDPSYSLIMTHVFRILGHLHQIGAFPDLIYNYTSPADQTVLQRPPTLYLLSKRIMSLLSDVQFDLHWKQEVLKYRQQGYEISNTSFAPRIGEFGPELWLDLILWACVEGGWIREGAWLIGQIERRKGESETRWSVISWQEICARKEPKLDWPSILRLQIDRTRLNQVGSIGIATGTDSTVDMGTRTISQEVVLAIVDGLLNSRLSADGEDSFAVHESLLHCKSLLERGHPNLDDNLLNAVILRILETIGLNEQQAPGALQQIIDIRTRSSTTKNALSAEPVVSAQDADTDGTAPILGLLHRNLSAFAEEGNLNGSLVTFRKIQRIVDSKRESHILKFAQALNGSFGDLVDVEDPDRPMTSSLQIPVHVLATFLDLITESKSYEIGLWLSQNEDVDGGAIEQSLYSNANLQPALLRFATATANESLLTKILAEIEQPIPELVLHALLRCQVAVGNWPAVRNLFEHFQRTPGMSWKASDVIAIARAILQLENRHLDGRAADQMARAQELLVELLQGMFNSPQDPSQLPDFSEAKLASQLGRIFKTLPGRLKNVVPTPSTIDRRTHASVSITPNAFNILLEAMIDRSDPAAAKELWVRWCRDPGEESFKSNSTSISLGGRKLIDNSTPDAGSERVVTPTQYMLRNILRPILAVKKLAPKKSSPNGDTLSGISSTSTNEEDKETKPMRRPLTSEEIEILDWGISMYKKFGLSPEEINNEIPGAISRNKDDRLQ